MSEKRIQVMGYYISPLTMDETVEKIHKMIIDNRKCQHVVLNAGKIVMANKDERLKRIINECEITNADGQSVVWAARFLGKIVPERVTGIDLMYKIIAIAEKNEYGVYFFGAREEVLQKAVDSFIRDYPGLKISGKRNGYFTDGDLPHIISDMKNSGAKILFVAISSPMKEYWLSEHIDEINIPFCMGVGGSFDIAAGLTKRAPVIFQKFGLEWFYRLAQEPGRMWKRYLVGNTSFILYVLKSKFDLMKTREI